MFQLRVLQNYKVEILKKRKTESPEALKCIRGAASNNINHGKNLH